jgi:hypothetical protein
MLDYYRLLLTMMMIAWLMIMVQIRNDKARLPNTMVNAINSNPTYTDTKRI